MNNTTKIQLRGNCPCCGNLQAVLGTGRMSKHGYTVDHGWFSGVCSGEKFAPMQKDRTVTDKIVADIRKQVSELLEKSKDLQLGKVRPTAARSGNRIKVEDNSFRGYKMKDEMVPFAIALKTYQDEAVRIAINEAESRARIGTSFANDLEALVNRVHGQPLVEVKQAAPERIQVGEVRKSEDYTYTVTRVEGVRVYYTWKRLDSDASGKSWQGVQAFRKLEKVGG